MKTLTQEQISEAQERYNNLVMERVAFEQAGMDAKVAEWDYKIAQAEIDGQFPRITFREMADEIGLDGLTEAVFKRNTDAEDLAEELLEESELLNCRMVSESKMLSFIDKYQWRYENNPEVTQILFNKITPKLHPSKQAFYKMLMKVQEMEKHSVIGKSAFMKIEPVNRYMQDDNPPMEELMKLAKAQSLELFDELYVAYPMIDKVKQIDPIFFGVKKDPTKQYSGDFDFQHTSGFGFRDNTEITADMVDTLNIGTMSIIGQWV